MTTSTQPPSGVHQGFDRRPRRGLPASLLVATLCTGFVMSGMPSTAASKPAGSKPTTTVNTSRKVSAVRLAEANVAKARSGGDQRVLANALKDLGYQQQLAKDFTASVKTLNEAATLYRKLKDDSSLAATLQMLGWSAIQGEKPSEALTALTEAVSLRRKLLTQPGGNLALVEALQLLALAQRGSGKGAEAIKSLEEVLTMAASGTKGIDTATTALSIGSAYMELKNPAAAVGYFERAVRETEGKPSKQVDALQALGWALTGAGRAAEAVPTLQKAIKLAGASAEKSKRGVDLYSLLANAAREANQSTVEIDARVRIVAFARAGTPGVTLEDALDALGLTLIFEQRFTDAVPPLRELVTLSRKGPVSPRLGTALHNLGWALSSARQYPEAIAHLEEAVQIRTQLNDPDLITSLRFLGYAMWSTKDPRATENFAKALELLKKKPAVTEIDLAQGYLDVSSSKLFDSDYDGAVQPARTALELFTKANATEEQLANGNYNVGWALFSSGNPAESIPFLTKARDIRTKNSLDGAADAASLLAAAIAQTKA
jgi:tetratricopeptide (TPR) repeat protein